MCEVVRKCKCCNLATRDTTTVEWSLIYAANSK